MRNAKEKEIEDKYGRTGKCKQCGTCCKVLHIGSVTKEQMKYLVGFGYKEIRINRKRHAVLYQDCKHLKNNKCTIWGTKEFPLACRLFPAPMDGVYHICKKSCGFKYPKKVIVEYMRHIRENA